MKKPTKKTKPKKPVIQPMDDDGRPPVPDANGKCPEGYYNNGQGQCILDS